MMLVYQKGEAVGKRVLGRKLNDCFCIRPPKRAPDPTTLTHPAQIPMRRLHLPPKRLN